MPRIIYEFNLHYLSSLPVLQEQALFFFVFSERQLEVMRDDAVNGTAIEVVSSNPTFG